MPIYFVPHSSYGLLPGYHLGETSGTIELRLDKLDKKEQAVNIFKKIFSAIVGAFKSGSKEDRAVRSILAKLGDIADDVLPLVRIATKLTPPEGDDEAVDKFQYWVDKVKELGLDPGAVMANGARLAISSKNIRDWLAEQVTVGGRFKYGGIVIDTLEEVLALKDSDLNTIAQTMYRVDYELRKIEEADTTGEK
jgi:hypothetical protein